MAECKYSGDMLTFTFSSRRWYNKSFRNRLPLKKLSSDEVAQLDTFQSATIQFLLDVYVLFHPNPLFINLKSMADRQGHSGEID